MELIDIVHKLVGPIQPAGDASIDDKRLENLKAMTELVDKLVGDIGMVAAGYNSDLHSVKLAGKFADDFLTNLGIEE